MLAAEERAKGNLKFEVILGYLKSVKSWYIVFMTVLSLALAQVAISVADFWLSYWYVLYAICTVFTFCSFLEVLYHY